MINLLETGAYLQAVFMSVLFLEAVMNVCCIPNLFIRDYKLLTKLFTVLFNLVLNKMYLFKNNLSIFLQFIDFLFHYIDQAYTLLV